jgi:hypothetical protein
MTICAVLVLAGGIGASILSAINITPPYGDILLIAALFVAVIPDLSDRRDGWRPLVQVPNILLLTEGSRARSGSRRVVGLADS